MEPARRVATEDEYLAFERSSSERHEYVNGEIIAMAGGSPRHAALTARVGRDLGIQLEGRPCEVLSSDLRVHVSTTGLYTYPDVTVVCGKPEFHPKDPHSLLNPTLIVEVLSDSTEAYDRGAKSVHYRRIPSLAAHVLVSQTERHIELFQRRDGGLWEFSERSDEGILPIPILGVSLDLARIYANIEQFPT
jgi:Uma2 family endonuclease